MSAAKHISDCKARALALIAGSPRDAWMQFAAEMGRHPEVQRRHAMAMLHTSLSLSLDDVPTPQTVREKIEAFA